jgi:MarR family transcriptional regulator, lower aerobic nicotinate degradation pathway regulator
MNYQLLQQLLEHLQKFEDQNPDLSAHQSLAKFAGFLNQQVVQPAPIMAFASNENHPDETLEAWLSQLLAFNYRYAKVYIKQALDQSGFISLDDFGYLAGIWRKNGCTKTEIIELNIHEKTTGMEIIRRLLHRELIVQEENPNDRRSKILRITPKGLETFRGSLESMHRASIQIAGNLDETEKVQLFYLLQKLHQHHNPIFLGDKKREDFL